MKKIIFVVGIAFLLAGCSLKYDEAVRAEDTNPEFTFTDTKLTRYENGKKTAQVTAAAIEQYRGSDSTYAKKITFVTYNDKSEIDTEGSCGLMYSNSESEVYELFENIKLFSSSQKANFFADMLRWNNKSEQLVSGRTDTVKIEKDDTIIYGSGFSASGISGEYIFSGAVSGDITTKDKSEETNEEGEK